MLLHLAGLGIICYLIFVFTSDHLNPFTVVRAPLRQRRIRLGKAMALSSLAAGVIAIALFDIGVFDIYMVFGLYLFLTLALSIPAVMKYRKSATWQ